jgi:hypothetical protein
MTQGLIPFICLTPVLKTTRFWGVTPPISVAASSEREREITATLMDELRRQNTFETEEESRRRCERSWLCVRGSCGRTPHNCDLRDVPVAICLWASNLRASCIFDSPSNPGLLGLLAHQVLMPHLQRNRPRASSSARQEVRQRGIYPSKYTVAG